MPTPSPWMLAAAASFSAMLAVLVAFHMASALREWRMRRNVLSSLQANDRERRDDRPESSVLRARAEDEEGIVRILGGHVPQLWDLHHLLGQSGLRWSLEGFLGRTVASAAGVGLVVALVSANGWLGGIAFCMGAFGPHRYVLWKKSRRILQLESQLPDAIDLIARAVRAGHPLSEGLRMTSEEAPEPLASEFRITFEEQKFGLPFEDALLGLGDRVEVVDIRILITAILVQREVGGNLSEILEQISETMRARFALKRQVRVYTAQGRMSGYTLAALPIFVGFAVALINPDYMQTLFQETLGKAMLASAATLQVIGFLWIRRIVDVRY